MTRLASGFAAVVFDFYGTLTPVNPAHAWAEEMSRLAGVLGVAPEALIGALDASWPERATGALGDVRQTVRTLAERLGARLSGDRLDEACRLRQSVQEALMRLRPDAVPVIGQLRAGGLRIGLISDCSPELPEAWPQLPLADLVDAAVFSCAEGTRKPDPRLFTTVAARLGVAPAACLYVGDGGGRELTGASSVGMHAVLLAGPDWLSHHVYDRESGWAGPRITSLTELVQ